MGQWFKYKPQEVLEIKRERYKKRELCITSILCENTRCSEEKIFVSDEIISYESWK